jgi:hypothetical protein
MKRVLHEDEGNLRLDRDGLMRFFEEPVSGGVGVHERFRQLE